MALPTEPGAGAGSLVLTVTSDRAQLDAGTTTAATITIVARKLDGSVAPDGTDVSVNTSLGNFGLDDSGKPLQLVTRKLAGGVITIPFFAGSAAGTANILAQSGTSIGKLNLAIVTPGPVPAAPVADFDAESNGLSVIFTDKSTGSPTQHVWTFGDQTGSAEVSPSHTYAAPGTYTVTLTVSSAGGTSTKSKFVALTAPDLKASFTFEVSGRKVIFTDTSTGNPTSWRWGFSDGDSSSERNPTHTFAAPGTYGVTLTIGNAFGGTATASRFVTLEPVPVPDFKVQTSGLSANFTDASTGATSWAWSFGDCSDDAQACTDSRQNPSHTYLRAGTYNVTLTVANASGTAQKSQFVTVSNGTLPKADFTVQTAGLSANFADASTGATSWSWNFGDCADDAQACVDARQNPTHVYRHSGTFNVTLTVTNAAGSAQKSEFVSVSSGVPPKADFDVQINGLRVSFTDKSTGNPTQWEWLFGDCINCFPVTEQNPVHDFPGQGSYTVTLTVRNSQGSNSISKVVKLPPD